MHHFESEATTSCAIVLRIHILRNSLNEVPKTIQHNFDICWYWAQLVIFLATSAKSCKKYMELWRLNFWCSFDQILQLSFQNPGKSGELEIYKKDKQRLMAFRIYFLCEPQKWIKYFTLQSKYCEAVPSVAYIMHEVHAGEQINFRTVWSCR